MTTPSTFYPVLGCLINKVASSSIVKTFLHLDGRLDPTKDIKSPHAYAKRLYPKVNEPNIILK